MAIIYEAERDSDSSFVDMVWYSQSAGSGSFISSATSKLEMVITKQQGGVSFSILGPFTRAFPAPIPEDAEFIGITLKLGTFIPCLPVHDLINGGIQLPEGAGRSFWLHGSTWQLPDFENADIFIDRLVHQGLLAHEPMVEAALNGQIMDLSERSLQRRFRRITGLTHGTLYQIERARLAMTLLQQGVSILDTVEQAGYYDQPT